MKIQDGVELSRANERKVQCTGRKVQWTWCGRFRRDENYTCLEEATAGEGGETAQCLIVGLFEVCKVMHFRIMKVSGKGCGLVVWRLGRRMSFGPG